MTDIVERLTGPDYWISGNADGSEGHNSAPFDAAIEIKRLREELAAADAHAKRLEAVVEKMTVWEPSKGGRLG